MTDFLTSQNKGFIWGLLSEQQLFDGVNPKHKAEIQQKFEKTLLGISTQGRFYNLVEKNKEAIRIMVLMLEDYRNRKDPYTALEIQEQRQKKFETELQKKKTEFTVVKPIPDEIDFSYEKDTPLEESMDVLLARAMSVREQQLNQVLDKQDTQKATDWIGTSKTNNNSQAQPQSRERNNTSNTSNSTNSTNSTNSGINLKIGSDTSLSSDHIVSLDASQENKKVNFNESKNTVFSYQREIEDENKDNNFDNLSFLSKFKKTDDRESEKSIQTVQETNKEIRELKEQLRIINDKLDRVLLGQKELLDFIILKARQG